MTGEYQEWEIPPANQPKQADCAFDLSAALASVFALRSEIPEDAFTAAVLGTERAGNGVLIRADGLVLTIGYLVAEAETVWLLSNDGAAIPAHVVAYDHHTGFGLVQALAKISTTPIPFGNPQMAEAGDPVIIAGHGGMRHALSAWIAAKREFAGYWEYLVSSTKPSSSHRRIPIGAAPRCSTATENCSVLVPCLCSRSATTIPRPKAT